MVAGQAIRQCGRERVSASRQVFGLCGPLRVRRARSRSTKLPPAVNWS